MKQSGWCFLKSQTRSFPKPLLVPVMRTVSVFYIYPFIQKFILINSSIILLLSFPPHLSHHHLILLFLMIPFFHVNIPQSMLKKTSKQLPSIQDHFAAINSRLQEKASLDSTSNIELSTRKQRLARLQQILESTMERCTMEKEQMKQKISVLKSCLKQSTQKDSQSRIHIRNRMEVLTQNVHQHLSMHSQLYDMVLKQNSKQFNQTLIDIQQTRQKNTYNDRREKIAKIRNILKEEVENTRKKLQLGRLEGQKREEEVLAVVQMEIGKWRQAAQLARGEWQQEAKTLREQVETARMEIQLQLGIQRREREENKQKILTLLQNTENMGKSIT